MRLKIDKFLLWRLKAPEISRLNFIFAEIAHFFELEPLSIDQFHQRSFKEAIYFFAGSLNLKAVPLIKDELFYHVPLIARDKKLDQAVVLLPYGEQYLVKDSNKSYFIKAKKVSTLFDEHILLLPIEDALNHKSSTPWFGALAIFSGGFFGATLFSATALFTSDDEVYWALAALFSLSLAVLIGQKGFKVSIKDYGLSLFQKLHDFYTRWLFLPLEQFLQQSPIKIMTQAALIRQSLHAYYFNRFVKVFSVSAVFLSLFLCWLWIPSLALFLLVGSAFIALLTFFLENLHQKLMPTWLKHQQNLAETLEQYHLAFETIAKLKAFTGISKRINRQKARLEMDEQKLFVLTYWRKSGRFYGPIILFMAFSWWRFLGAERSLAELMFLSFAAIFLGLLVATASENLFFKPKPSISLPKVTGTHVEPVNIIGAFELINLMFSYPDSSNLVFKNYHLKINAHEFYTITGASGSGKSTLLKLIMGLLAPVSGQVVIDGQDLRSLNLPSLRKNFGVIFDDSQLFMGSIYENIMCGRDISPKALEQLFFSHEIFDALLDMPMGVQSFIFWHQKNLSHYEKALILLARALVHQPKILIMDELITSLSHKDQERIVDYLSGLSITRILVSNNHEALVKTRIIKLG